MNDFSNEADIIWLIVVWFHLSSLWCDEEPEFELPASSLSSMQIPKSLPKDLIAPNAFTDDNVSP